MGIKRMNYFNGEFLKEEDFKIEQQYHVDMLRAHNRNLHSWGIASGLDIDFKSGERKVTIKKGMVIDALGRQLIVDNDREKKIPDNITASELFMTIAYRTNFTDSIDNIPGMDPQYTRIEEDPAIEFLEKNDFEKTESGTPVKIFLARVILNNDKTIFDIDLRGRKYAGDKDDDDAIRFDHILGHKHTGKPDDGPLISHKNLDNVLAANTTSNDITANKHVSDALAKNWQDHINNRENPHGTTAAQLSDYLANLFMIPKVLQFTQSDPDGKTIKEKIGFSPKLVLINGGFEVTLGRDKEGSKKEIYGSSFSGFWASNQAGCSSQHIRKQPYTDIEIYSSAEMGYIFYIYVFYNDTNMLRAIAETITGKIDILTPGYITVKLNRKVTQSCDPIDTFSISLCVLCIS